MTDNQIIDEVLIWAYDVHYPTPAPIGGWLGKNYGCDERRKWIIINTIESLGLAKLSDRNKGSDMSLTTRGLDIVREGGWSKHLQRIEMREHQAAASKQAERLAEREQRRIENHRNEETLKISRDSLEIAKSARNATWVATFIALGAFLFSIYLAYRNTELEKEVGFLKASVGQLALQTKKQRSFPVQTPTLQDSTPIWKKN